MHPPKKVLAVSFFKGELSPNLLSKVSLPVIKVLIEKFLSEILGRLGKENPSRRRFKVALVQRKCSVMSRRQLQYDICTLRTTSQHACVRARIRAGQL